MSQWDARVRREREGGRGARWPFAVLVYCVPPLVERMADKKWKNKARGATAAIELDGGAFTAARPANQ